MNIPDTWKISYLKSESGPKSYGQEALLSLGNGFLGWRGAPVFSQESDDHYPGLYLAGCYNQTTTPMAGKEIVNEDLVNLPNPQLFRIFIADQEIDYTKIKSRKSTLNMAQGRQSDQYTFETPQGLLTLASEKVVDPINYHLIGLKVAITCDFDSDVRVESVVDAGVLNHNVARYRDFDSQEFTVSKITQNRVTVKTRQSQLQIDLTANTQSEADLSKQVLTTASELVARFDFKAVANTTYVFTKVVGITVSNELDFTSQLVEQVADQVKQTTFDQLVNSAKNYWGKFWQDHDLIVEAPDSQIQSLIRLNIFHLQQAANHYANRQLDASVPARGLTGEGYRGHIFWDEIFFLPYYVRTNPAVAKDLLKYRINRLAPAQKNAAQDHEAGAMYPWQSAMYGDEQAQIIHLNPVNNQWDPDNSRRQRHVSLAIAYDVWYYYHLTGDAQFLNSGALAMLLEISKFWLNRAQDDGSGRYDISGVMGPDEFHEKYPDAKTGGFKNNAYTNILVAWLLNWIQELAQDPQVKFAEISQDDGFDRGWQGKAQAVSQKLNLEINPEGIIAQFAGYFDLKTLDFAAYEAKYGNIYRIDRILKAEGKSPDDYQVAKQADVLMAIYVLGATKMQEVINKLGYALPKDWLAKNTNYYLARTTHGSTTSRPVFAIALTDLGQIVKATDYLVTALGSDFNDIQGGTTAEGIHVGVMGETIEVITRCFAGIDINQKILKVKPQLPPDWRRIEVHCLDQGVNYRVEVTPEAVTVTADQDQVVQVGEQQVQLKANQPELIVQN